MEKITTKAQFNFTYSEWIQLKALSAAFLTKDNVWIARETARIVSGDYTPLGIEGDDPLHFLHVSLDDSDKVSYTKDAEHGRADIQTRTTMPRYCEKFGLVS